jgi:hypothetical protein
VEEAQSDEDEQRTNKRRTKAEREEDFTKAICPLRWRDGAMASSLRVFENMNRGVATIIEALALAHRATPRVTVSFIFLIWPSSPPLGALSTLAHQFSEPPAPHLINQKLLTPPSAINLKPVDAIQFATFRETKPPLLLFGPRRSACRHHMSIRFLDPMRLSHRTEGSGTVTPTAERTRWVGPVQPDPLGL